MKVYFWPDGMIAAYNNGFRQCCERNGTNYRPIATNLDMLLDNLKPDTLFIECYYTGSFFNNTAKSACMVSNAVRFFKWLRFHYPHHKKIAA